MGKMKGMVIIMKLDEIKAVGELGMWCHDKALASVATWSRGEYELAYKDLWQFSYERKSNYTIGNGLKTNPWNQDLNLEKYYGIKFYSLSFNDAKEFILFAKKEIAEGRPVVCEFDEKFALWLKDSENDIVKKNIFDRFNSVLLIVGLLPDEKGVHVFDVHLDRESDLSMDNLMKGFISQICIPTAFSFSEAQIQNINYQDLIIEIVDQTKSKVNGCNMFDRINMFANDLENSFNFDDEIMGVVRVEDTPLILNLTTIARSRAIFSHFITHVGKKLNNQRIIDISDDLQFSKWTFLKSLLFRALFKHTIYGNTVKQLHEQISKTAKNIALDEEKIANDLLMALKTSQIHAEKNEATSLSLQECIPLQISEFYNNDAFSKVDSNSENETMPLKFFKDGIEKITGTFTCGNMTFNFPGITEGKNNNFVCEEQEIKIPEGVYSSICFLATAESECVVDRAKIIYKNGNSMDMTIKVSDWWYYLPIYGEIIAWQGEIPQIYSIFRSEKCNIFAVEYPLPMPGSIEAIVLPFRPTLHIFGLSMRKAD